MIKRTLCFGNPAYLSTKNEQLVVQYPDSEGQTKTVPIEDIGLILLENPQITISNKLLEKLLQNGAALINCNTQHMPIGMLMSLDGHSEQSERWRTQIDASIPLKKNLWQQTVAAKITNQAMHLKECDKPFENMLYWSKSVSSGDKMNHEARAAAYYWSQVFSNQSFRRHRAGEYPNNMLNYAYAILRGITARALVSSGMLPTLGIHHKNKYNAYCLADDIMEPYRPYADYLVAEWIKNEDEDSEMLSTRMKKHLLSLPTLDVIIEGVKSPLMLAMSRSTNSLYECFSGISRKLVYPIYE